MQQLLFSYPGLDVRAGSVFDLVFDRSESTNKWGEITGVKLGMFFGKTMNAYSSFNRKRRYRLVLPGCHLYRHISFWRNPYGLVGVFFMWLCFFSDNGPGMKRFPAGRLGDDPSIGLSGSLNAAGFKLGRLQTGTPARLDKNTINFSGMNEQLGDVVPSPFSFMNNSVDNAVSLTALIIYSGYSILYARRTK